MSSSDPQDITIRPYAVDDASGVTELFRSSVRQIASRDYTVSQIRAWAPDVIDQEQFGRRRETRSTWVAESEGRIAGFSDLQPDGHVDMLYVHPDFQRRGVARALLRHIEETARTAGLRRLYTEASITARPVFEAMGFRAIAQQTVTIRGETMVNYRMEKRLAPPAEHARESQGVRAAFASQAEYCRRLGSPFTARLCEALAADLDMSSPAGSAILGWTGDPSPLVDNVPLRTVGALNALARSRAAPYLAALYPPNPLPDAGELSRAVLRALGEHPERVLEFLSSPPQTNEVGRSAVLIGGLLTIARRTSLPLDVYEIGSSAGLNLRADRYRYRLGSADWGAPDATLCLAPSWNGPPPPLEAALTIRSRSGCDANPIDVRDARARERLVAYVWADQTERIARIEAAIDVALSFPVAIDSAEAADWVERRIEIAPVAGITRVLFHSVVWSYLSEGSRDRIRAHVSRAAAAATGEAPFAWLRFELADPPELRLTLWPSGDEMLLARAHPHGTWVRWLA